jgi:hypothetical protein
MEEKAALQAERHNQKNQSFVHPWQRAENREGGKD